MKLRELNTKRRNDLDMNVTNMDKFDNLTIVSEIGRRIDLVYEAIDLAYELRPVSAQEKHEITMSIARVERLITRKL